MKVMYQAVHDTLTAYLAKEFDIPTDQIKKIEFDPIQHNHDKSQTYSTHVDLHNGNSYDVELYVINDIIQEPDVWRINGSMVDFVQLEGDESSPPATLAKKNSSLRGE